MCYGNEYSYKLSKTKLYFSDLANDLLTIDINSLS